MGWGMMYYFVPILLQAADVESWAVAGGILGTGVLLSAAGDSPLPVHADSDVPAIWSCAVDDRVGVCGADSDHQLRRDAVGNRDVVREQSAVAIFLHRDRVLLPDLLAVCTAESR